MRFVPIKTIEQQDIQSTHRIRSRLMVQRTGLVNQVRGLLAEYGIIIAQGISRFRTLVPTILEDDCPHLTSMTKSLFWNLYEQFKYLDTQITLYDHKIKQLCQESEICQRLLQVDGVGPLTASALIAAVGDGKVFNKARQLSAFLGLVPRQSSSGGKTILLGISKRGNVYLRTLLVHGARSVVMRASSKKTKLSQWLRDLIQRRGYNKACVALANKNARILWAILTKQTVYQTEV